ncbi:MAG: helix-turn-helix transcriptional regulator [Actinomycetota bacterium]|nr:helix-turn-helix transcriptional regulator [Actinomycetota bacterium]
MTNARAHPLAGAIERVAHRTQSCDHFFAELSGEVAKAVPFDGSIWLGVDPATLLASAPVRIQNMDAAYCWPFWEAEFRDQDAAQFRDLARDPVPVTALRLATDGRPRRSARFRDFMEPQGYHDEARVAFRVGTTTWAVAALYREKGRPAFTTGELRILRETSRAVAIALRDHTLTRRRETVALRGPGVLLFDQNAGLVSANVEAAEWLAQIYGGHEASWKELMTQGSSTEQLVLYPSLQPLVTRARAVALGYDEGPVRSRVRDRSGRWVVLHASCLDATGSGMVAVVVEPAKSAEIAPIIVEAYGLTPRERELVRALARGLSTPEIAAEMFVSTHTVRDYVKSVFEKLAVSSRGELIAKLFADHYYDEFQASAVVTNSVGPD